MHKLETIDFQVRQRRQQQRQGEDTKKLAVMAVECDLLVPRQRRRRQQGERRFVGGLNCECKVQRRQRQPQQQQPRQLRLRQREAAHRTRNREKIDF